MIQNLFIRETDNIGDYVCGPSLYFPGMGIRDVTKWKEISKDDIIILGGGGLFHLPSEDYNNGVFGHIEELLTYFPKVILWGVGHNVHGTPLIKYPDYMERFQLVGIRDFTNNLIAGKWNWVPDPSCMCPLFTLARIKYPRIGTAGYFCHKTFHEEKDLPTEFCEGISFERAVKFLASFDMIYTNSYHGAYWSLLMNKPVIVEDPYSSKFFGLPGIISLFNGKGLLINPIPNFLKICREINRWYFEIVSKKVKELL